MDSRVLLKQTGNMKAHSYTLTEPSVTIVIIVGCLVQCIVLSY